MPSLLRVSLADSHPAVAAEWHPDRNDGLTARDVSAGSGKKAWWRCQVDPAHEWQAKVLSRVGNGSGCPKCASLAVRKPALAAEWHPERNGDLAADGVTPGSNKKVWWRCAADPKHEWEAVVAGRVRGNGCPLCGGKVATPTTSLRALRPDLAAEWHPERNGELTPDDVTPGSGKRAWWRCSANPKHEWEAVIGSRAQGSGCPICARKVGGPETSLRATHPEVAAEWHPERNGGLTPDRVVAGSEKKAWWRCSIDPTHEWQARVYSRAVNGSGCPRCRSLDVARPDLAAEWHPTRNDGLTPADVTPGSTRKAWWRCSADPTHEWPSSVANRAAGNGCPLCSGRVATETTSLAALRPDLAAEWHPERNGDLTPDGVVPGSGRKVWWRCAADPTHEWEGVIHRRADGVGCPACGGRVATPTTSLRATHPEVAAEWHPDRNGGLTPDDVVPGSAREVWWRCSADPSHEWAMVVYARTRNGSGCPACNKGWTVKAIRGFVASLVGHLAGFTPAELYLLFQQNGLLGLGGKGKSFARALATGRFPVAEVEKFAKGEGSLVDEFLADPARLLEDADKLDGQSGLGTLEPSAEDAASENVSGGNRDSEVPLPLPLIEAGRALAALDHAVVSSADEEAVAFLIGSAVAKLWAHAFRDEAAAVAQAERFAGGEYAERARDRFLDEYRRVKDLPIPAGYAYSLGGRLVVPNLMQGLVAVRVRDDRRVGNWSGTGAGKTLSAVLASRVVGSRLTVICCPNSVVAGWAAVIRDAFPDSRVAAKTFEPDWGGAAGGPRYLILNYEAFQQPDSADRVRALIASGPIDLLIIDEVHHAKQREPEAMSRRRANLTALSILDTASNGADLTAMSILDTASDPGLRVLGMSATPVVNNLQEGRSLVELVTGLAHDDLATRPTVPNCMRLHQRLATLGIRWMPQYDSGFTQVEVPVDCSGHLDEIRELARRNAGPLELEQVLVRARLPVIRDQIRPGTLIYTHYIAGIDRTLREAIEADGWRVGYYTGDDKSGLAAFLRGDIDVLIGTGAIGTGVDGLQRVCNRLIVAVLPWTAAEFEQLRGRLFRQGQRRPVTVVIPVTSAEVNGGRWSWCESRLARLRFKKSIADAAVDGVVPEGHLRSPEQAYRDVMGWLDRLDRGEVEVIARPALVAPATPPGPAGDRPARRHFGEFSDMNRAWNAAPSAATHERLQADPAEWHRYHELYLQARREWALLPLAEMIHWCLKRSGYTIGDFGCGEAALAATVFDLHTVHSFDHVAYDDTVTVCDLASVPLPDGVLDLAVFSLSLMGSNFADYLREAHRTLRLDGELHIYEATSRFADRDRFARSLADLGFAVVTVEDRWKFTHIRALKTDRRPRPDVAIAF